MRLAMDYLGSVPSLRLPLSDTAARLGRAMRRSIASRKEVSMKAISGKTVIVTGASQGSGKAIAKAFAEHGANVCMIARNEERLREAAEEVWHAPSDLSSLRFFAHLSRVLRTCR